MDVVEFGMEIKHRFTGKWLWGRRQIGPLSTLGQATVRNHDTPEPSHWWCPSENSVLVNVINYRRFICLSGRDRFRLIRDTRTTPDFKSGAFLLGLPELLSRTVLILSSTNDTSINQSTTKQLSFDLYLSLISVRQTSHS